MHRMNLMPRFLLFGLLIALGLGALVSWSTAQPPGPIPAMPGVEDKEKILHIPLEQFKLLQAASKLEIAKVDNQNDKVALVEEIKGNPFVIKVTGMQPGYTTLIITDKKNNVEIKEIHVLDTDEELFQIERKKLERKRATLLQMINKAVPSANVDVILGITRNRVTNDNSILTGSIVLTGTVFEAEKIQLIIDLANAVFGGVASTTSQSGNQPGPLQSQQNAGSNSIIGPGAIQPLGNRITIINNLRLGGVQQVELSVVVAIVNRSMARTMGFNWFNENNNWFLTSFVNPAVGVTSALATAATAAAATGTSTGTAPNLSFGVLNPKNGFTGFLQALRSEALVKVLSEPRVMTLSGRPANFIDGGQIPVITSSTGGSSVSYLQFGTVINFVPIVLGNGKIHLEVAASISQPETTLGVSVATTGSLASAPGLTTKGAQVAVQLEDGQTMAIGGLIQNNVTASTAKIPFLGDMPFIGVGFRSVSFTESEEELIILVTPRLVDPMACSQLPKYLPGRSTRNADDFELFLEGIMEAPRGQRDVFPGGLFHYTAAFQNPGGNNPPYPCNDSPNPHRGTIVGALNGGCSNCQSDGCGMPGTLQPGIVQQPGSPMNNKLPQPSEVQPSIPPMPPKTPDRAPLSFPGQGFSPLPMTPPMTPPPALPLAPGRVAIPDPPMTGYPSPSFGTPQADYR